MAHSPADNIGASTAAGDERATQAVLLKRKDIIRQITMIQPKAGKNMKDLEIPQSVFQLAREIVLDSETGPKFKKVAVYDLLLGDLHRRTRESVTPDNAGPVLDGWKRASISLFRYALNLTLAPKRPEFKKIKLSTSFYVYNISRNLHRAEHALKAMGYSVDKESVNLVYDGDVKRESVLETATDLVVMHEEVVHLKEMLQSSGREDISLENMVERRHMQFATAQDGSGIAPPNQSPHQNHPHQQPNPTHLPPVTTQSHGRRNRTDHDYVNLPNESELFPQIPPARQPLQSSCGYVNLSLSQLGTTSNRAFPPLHTAQLKALQVQRYQESKGLPIESAVREAGLLISDLQETGRILGTGAYGEVIEVTVRGRTCAAKKLHGIFTARDVPPKEKSAAAERFETECRRVLYLSHPNIIEMIGIHFDEATHLPTLVMELMDTSLCKYLENNPESSVLLSTKYGILHDVASGLLYLHTLPPPLGPIVHRDLTANNILLALGIGVVAKIADLGQAKIDPMYATRQQKLSQVPGNEYHMPPEAWLDNPVYNASLDVFSFGVVMLHTLTHEWPKPLGRLKSAMEVCPEVERRKPYLDKISESPLKPVVEQCLSQLPQDRPSTNDVFRELKVYVGQLVCTNLIKTTPLSCSTDIAELIYRLAGPGLLQGVDSHGSHQIVGSPPSQTAKQPVPLPRKIHTNAPSSPKASLPPPITDFTSPLDDTHEHEQKTLLRRKRSPSIKKMDGDKPYYSYHQSRRQVRSGSNLETEFLQDEKPQPTPRRSLSGRSRPFYTSSPKPRPAPRRSLPSSPSGSGRPSPASSPKPQPRSATRHSWSHVPTSSSLPPAELSQTLLHQKNQQQQQLIAPRRSLPSSPSGSGRPSPASSPKPQPRSATRHSWSHVPTSSSLPPAELSQTLLHQKNQQQQQLIAPRRSLPSSPSGSGRPSPASSPKPQPRSATRHSWSHVPTSSSLPPAELSQTLPHQKNQQLWVCEYCTNLNPDTFPVCEVCERPHLPDCLL